MARTVPWHGGERTCVEVKISPPVGPGSAEIAVGACHGQAGVAAVAQGLKIVLAVGTALIDGNFVVHVGSGNKAASGFAKFTQGMTADVQVSDLAPAVAVGLVVAGTAAVFIVTKPPN